MTAKKKILQRETDENYQNLPEKERNKKRKYNHNPYRKLFMENELSEEEKKRQYARNLYKIFLKKKSKGVNMLANNIELF